MRGILTLLWRQCLQLVCLSSTASDRPSSQLSRSSRTSDRLSSQSAAQNVRPQNSGSGSGRTGTAASMGRNANSLRLDQRYIQFSANAWVLVVVMLGMLPILPRNLSNKAYRLSLLSTACSSVYSLYTLNGKPRAWNLPAIQTWFQTLTRAKDFIHLIYCITLVSSQLHFKFALIPVFSWALEDVAKFLRWQRNIIQTFIYWQGSKQMTAIAVGVKLMMPLTAGGGEEKGDSSVIV
ncbi:Uncharacterized protein family (UPF0121) [Musa troglodytarum]|uniref:Uncharacterized protein family (UPF0121) n=1 Tax=Musa troglodytarum TaxID=320322 RepID=A0A9E7KGK0_9LILI|nr:Uncharacterized protein family (UPF0121) [Musa troglodytarum]